MTEVLDPPVIDLPPIDVAMIDAPRTDVAVAAAAAIDLKKLDLTAVALAQFGDWRAAVAKLKADNEKTVLVLPTQAKIDEAVSLRQRTIKAPLAEARKVETALKSKLAQVSKAVGAELAELIAGYEDAGTPLTRQIEAAQKVIDDEKEAKRQAENVRLSGLRDAVDGIMAKWLERCNAEGMTAERLGKGIEQFAELAMPTEVADVQDHWAKAHRATLAAMGEMKATAAAREEAARLEAQRIENERVAAEQRAQAEALAAQQRALAEQAEALKRQADEFAAQQASAAEAREQANREQCAFEDWVNKNSPSGDVEAVQRQWEASAEYHDLHGIEYRPATMATTEGKAETPGAGSAEAAPNTAATLPTESALDELEAPPLGDPQGSSAGSAQGVDSRESQAGSPVEARQPITQDAQESGFVPGTPGLYASSEAQAAQASPSGDEGRDARADECASQPDPALWAVHVEGPDDIEAAPSKEAAQIRADSLNQWAAEKRLADVCIQFAAKVVPWPFTPEAHAEDLRKLGHETNTTSEAAPQQATHPDTDDHGADLLLDAGTAEAEAAAEAAEFASWAAGPVELIEAARVEVRMDRALAGACYGFLVAFMQAYEGRFPTHPKPSQEWWAERRKDAESLMPDLLAAATGEGAR